MSNYVKRPIPSDVAENKRQMEDILAHWKSKYENLEKRRSDLEGKVLEAVNGFHEEVLQENLDRINDQMWELGGKIENMINKIEKATRYLEQKKLQDGLTHQPFAALAEEE